MAEAAIAAAIDRELARRRVYTVNITGTGVGRNGIADRLCCHLGQFVAIEIAETPAQAVQFGYENRPGSASTLRATASGSEVQMHQDRTQITKTCPHCGGEFARQPAQAKRQKYCSRQCLYASKRTRPGCPVCGARIKGRKQYCSHACRAVGVRITARCKVCLAPFETFRSRPKRHCSRRCYAITMAKRQIGAASHLWKGGKLSEARRIRNHPAYAAWRTSVYERDDYTCQHCGQRGGKLTAHHVKPFATYPRLRLKKSNGITLCRSCHLNLHRKGPNG